MDKFYNLLLLLLLLLFKCRGEWMWALPAAWSNCPNSTNRWSPSITSFVECTSPYLSKSDYGVRGSWKFDVERPNGRPRILDELQAIIRSAAPAVYRSELQRFLNNPLTKFHTRLRTEGGAVRYVIQIVGTRSKYVASPVVQILSN